jgi:Putative addiction module component
MLPEEESSSSIPESNVAEAWQREIARRLRQIDSGEVDLIPWEEVERRLWSKVRS